MSNVDDPFLPERKNLARHGFADSSNPKHRYGRIAGDAQAIKDVRSIEERAEKLRHKMRAHNDRHQQRWENQEIKRQTEKKSQPQHQHPSPGHERDKARLAPDKIQADAKREVEMRMNKKMKRLIRAESNMIEKRVSRSERTKAAQERMERGQREREMNRTLGQRRKNSRS